MDSSASTTACATCHPGSNSYTASHRDGQIKVSSRINKSSLTTPYNNNTSAFPQTAAPALGSCAGVNCHFETPTPTWGNDRSLTNCSTCHGAPPSGNQGNGYAGGAAGSHAKHYGTYSGSTNCIKCHADHTADPNPFFHAISGARRGLIVQPRTPLNIVSGSYAAAFTPITTILPSQAASHSTKFGSCTGTYCHGATMSLAGDRNGGANIVPTWGNAATAQCGTCHGATAASPPLRGSHKTHVYTGQSDFTPVDGGKPAPPSPAFYYLYGRNISCNVCHAGYSPLHVNGKVDWRFDKVTISRLNGAAYRSMTSGATSPVPSPSYGQCSNLYCHSIVQTGTGGALSGQPGEYKTPGWGNVDDGRCGSCHATDQMHAWVYGGMPQATPEIASGSHTKHLQSLGGIPGGPSRCASCHNYGGSDSLNGCASTCHTNEGWRHANYQVNVIFPPMHGSTSYNGTLQAGDGYGTCSTISCHGNTPAQWGGSACLGCHSVAQGKRAAITSQFASGSHHVQGTLTNAHCYQCHWEANSDGTINPAYHNSSVSGAAVRLVVYSAAARPKNAAKYFIAYTANGKRAQIQKISNHCLGCHSDQNNTAQPFGDGKTPKQYAWDGSSVAARYSQGGSTSWGKYTSAAYPNAAKKKIAKALSAHGNAAGNQRGWDITSGVDGAIANTSGAVAVQCYDCHNSHGSTVSGITSRYSSATGRNRGGILKNTVRGYGGYSSTYRPQAAGSVANKDVRNPGASICLDCHFSSNPKQAPFATFKGYTTPWGYNSTFSATQAVLGYWDSPYMGSGTAGVDQRYPFKAKNPVKGGHFGASSSLSGAPTSSIDGLCTPCHDPHGVSPTLGSNQQYAVPLLKGTWLTSPYQEDTSPVNNGDMYITGGGGLPYHIDQNTFAGGISNTAMPGLVRNDTTLSAGLCLGCHSKASLTNGSNHSWKGKDRIHEAVKGWKSANGVNQHSYTCSKCHAAHTSSVLPRLMVTNCLDSAHKGRSSLNINSMTASSGSGDYGSGSGRIPGVYGGWGDCIEGGPACGSSFSVNCHEGSTGSGANQSWNVVTPWAVATPPPAPTLTAQPDSSSSGGNRNITLQWGAVACPSSATTQYYVEVSTTPDFATINYNSGWLTAPVVSWMQPLPLGTWHWRVTARDSYDTLAQSAPSATDTFSISYAAPAAPTLTAQTSNNSSGGAISKTFLWSVVAPTDVDAVQYRVEVSTSASNFSTISYDSGWIAAASWTQSIPIGAWKWRVTTRDSVHTTAISAPSLAGNFSITLTSPSAPTLVAQPATSYTSGTNKSMTFNWSSVTAPDNDTCEYIAEVSANSSFSPVSYTSGWQSATNWTQVLPTGSWYWRVKARDSVHTTSVSNPSGFAVFDIAYAAPTAPTLIAQANYNSGSNVDVTFQWHAVTPTDADPMEYYVEVSSAADFATIAYQSVWQSPTSWTQSVAPGTWYWRAKTRDSAHTTAESSPSSSNSFTISTDPLPPIAPVLILQSGGNTACTTAYTHNLQWNAVTAPDGHAVEYFLQLDTVSSFDSANLQQTGWISATNWTTPSLTASTWYWRVKARDVVDTAMESPYSANSLFIDMYTWDCSCNNSCSSSCPLVYSWNGTGYRYETDLQGPAISQIKKGSRNVKLYQPSYITLEGLVPDANNQYRVKVWESLIEATLLDEAKLLAVDYPDGYQIATSGAENTYYYGYVDPFKIYTLKDPVPPITAIDKHGNNVLATLQDVDDNPAPMAPDDPDNYYTFDFGTIQHPENAKLVIDAWQIINSKIYLSTVTIQPYVEVVDANGAWVKVKSFGMPMGDLKTMIVDLSSKFLSSDHRVRLHLGIKKAQVWVIDKIRLDDSAPVNVSVQELPATSADLQLGGHAIKDMNTEQHRILVNDGSLPPHPSYYGYGNFTRLGEVGELLSQRDDKYVIMNYADKLDMTFPALAAPQAGMTRGFILKADNYYKEFKEYKYLEPLPFHGMSDYPPPAPEAYPTDLDHNQYRQDYNTRIFTP